MSSDFSFKLQSTLGSARAGQITTPHGVVSTPMFMPVGTVASVKALDMQDVKDTGAEIILANTYHLGIREQSLAAIEASGGIHNFMNWQLPVLTDSGGFQVFSLGAQLPHNSGTIPAKVDDSGVLFRSHLDGSKQFFTAERSVELQRTIGADIIMAFDDVQPDAFTLPQARASLDRTHAWAERCLVHWNRHERRSRYGKYQALFGIAQGGLHKELRQESVQFMVDHEFDGIAIGGETIGYNSNGTKEIMDWVRELLPKDKPRYAMGMGRDLSDVALAANIGFDMFDCVGPTRLARNGALLVGNIVYEDEEFRVVSPFARGRLAIGRQEFNKDFSAIDAGCDCYTCRAGYSRAYLRHLYRSKELSYYRLASIHNVRAMLRAVQSVRRIILQEGAGE
ncbi:MAG: tRNA guanosine(34) transglycosylase Tgt [Candidatus Pacebacteria bacterium]|nr:tRNA guanosine(34) transglycosylase Tgt [Candidatus Paceibacterota bacterium]